MKVMQIFEPAMCCPTGLCGVGVDPELLRISTVLNTLKKNGIQIDRFNLTSAPQEFVTNQIINSYIKEKGVESLPVITVDDEIVISGRYPTNEEFIQLLDVPKSYVIGEKPKVARVKVVKAAVKKNSGCGCSGGDCC